MKKNGVIDKQPTGIGIFGFLDDITASYSAYKLTSLSVESDAETFASRTGMRSEGTFGMEYDFAGRLTYDSSRDIRSISYDFDGLILGMDVGDDATYTYQRDGSGNMLSSTIIVSSDNGHSGIVKFREYTGNGHIIVDDSLKMTRFPGGYFTPDGGVYYYINDYQGNICKVVDKTGRVYQTMEYYPYGEPFQEWSWNRAEWDKSISSNRYLYSGNERETGLGVNQYDFQARSYVASFPRFGSPDPKSAKYAGISPYSYCAGDPINNIDPTGMEINMMGLVSSDQTLHRSVTQDLLSDLESQTGLQLTLNEDNILQYAKDENGNPIVSKTTDKDGNEIDAGSKTARNLLKNAIDDKKTVYVENGYKTGAYGDKIGLKYEQINGFIQGAVGVDGNTLGFGMTFLHELHHSPVGGNLPDELFDYRTGPVVDRMNQIRRELNNQGFNYGQRLCYTNFSTAEGFFIPFNTQALRALQYGSYPGKKAQYIKY